MKTRSRIAILMLALICLSVPAWSQQNQQEETSYLFQLVLLMGSIEGESKLEGVSANVVKALDDIREFLPYKSYKLVDTQLLRSAGRVEGLVSGPEGQDYRVEMGFTPHPDRDSLLVRRFSLADFGGTHTVSVTRGVSSGNSQSIDSGGVARAPRGPRRLIESSFSLDVGETIVVGSSKLNGGGEALLVLLTAIP
jgi:hypothetical protein